MCCEIIQELCFSLLNLHFYYVILYPSPVYLSIGVTLKNPITYCLIDQPTDSFRAALTCAFNKGGHTLAPRATLRNT